MSLCLLSCAGSTQVRETVSRPRIASSLAESKPWPTEALKASKTASPESTTPRTTTPKATTPKTAIAKTATAKSDPEAARDAKTSVSDDDEEWSAQDFSGVDTSAPVDSDNDEGPREIAIEGIEGTTSDFDVRTTLENRAQDFDSCHDRMGGGGGRIVYRIHILANGDVGGVKARTIKSRNRKLVGCYTEVVASSHFPHPHGGYADVKWTTKVGRSRKRPNTMLERPHRWDTPAGSRAAR
jgi:hypothetical protein